MLLTLRCPAKVNLFLAVGKKDFRNYHPVRTILQTIDLCDEMTISPGNTSHRVLFDDPSIPPDNTVTKALRLLSEIVSLPPLTITIQKQIPPESGLGGGSSNAATIIRAAQKITGVTIPTGELMGIAEAIGMDVPFFLVGGRAKGIGYGQKVSVLEDQKPDWIVVARPNHGASTGQAYRRLDDIEYEWQDFNTEDTLYNDFERVASEDSLSLIQNLKDLGAKDAALSGSGSAVFGRFPTMEGAHKAKGALLHKGVPKSWIAKTLTRSESLGDL